MRLRLEWIIGLIGLLIAVPAAAQEAAADKAGQKAGDADAAAAETNATETVTKPTLTGNPQIDYIHDPNLPHEVRGYDLSNYPFYARLPEDLLLPSFNFTCDDRHDGFYASVPHKCQVYHNCLFGQRYDFLCANYTVFDQKNFICHYVSEVDCENSANHYDRNDDLYKAATTTTTTPTPPQIIYVNTGGGRPRKPLLGGQGIVNRPNRPGRRPFGGNRRRTKTTTTTTSAPEYYDYYDEYQDYYDQYYDDYYYSNDYDPPTTTTTTTTTTPRPRRPNRPLRTRVAGGGGQLRPRNGNVFNVKNRKRPRINPPVPLDDEQFVQRPRASRLQQASPVREQDVDDVPANEPRQDNRQDNPSAPRRRPVGGRKPRPGLRKKPRPTTTTTTTTTTTEAVPEDDYYYDDYYYDYADESSTTTTTTTAAPSRPSRPSFGRPRPGGPQRRQQNQPSSTTTTTTTTEAPTTESQRSRINSPGRVNVRKTSVISNRRTPVDGATLLEDSESPIPTQDTASSQNQRPQRLRPQFPRRRPQSQPAPERIEVEVIEEAPPLAPGIRLTPDETPEESVDSSRPQRPAVSNQRVVSRTPIRRLGQSRPATPQRSSQVSRRRVQNRGSAPDYYDY